MLGSGVKQPDQLGNAGQIGCGNHAIDRDDCCLLATIAAALYFIQTRDYFKAIKAYQMAIYSIPFSPLSP